MQQAAKIQSPSHASDAVPQTAAQPADKARVLKEVFGYDAFRPGQEAVVDTLLAGVSVLAVMPTGAGKSLCFQIPALVLPGLTIVVSPLVALMQDQVAALKLAGVAADAIHSNQDRAVNVEIWHRVRRGETRILYLAPERLMTERMLAALAKLPVSLIAIDEAHCLSQWGPSFRPDYAALTALGAHFPDVPIAAMTATADKATRQDIEQQLFSGAFKTFVAGFDRPNITLNVALKNSWKKQLLDYVSRHRGVSGIVYCLSRKKTEEAAAMLQDHGINATAYHAGLSADQRSERQNRFVTEDDLIVAATVAFGMGIDKPDVRFVFHTDLPASIEAYYQEIGRAGRDGLPAEAQMIFGPGDMRQRRLFIEEADSEDDHKRREIARLNSLITYAQAQGCRRQTLLAYFGEQADPCGNCDNCRNPVVTQDGGEEANLVLAAIIETGAIYGQAHIVDVICGSESEKVLDKGHHLANCYGRGHGRPKSQWQSIIRQMTAAGLLEVDVAKYSSLLITSKGRAFMNGEGEFRFHEDAVKPGRRDKARASIASRDVAAADLSADEHELFAALKDKRLELAQARNVPAYIIFPDKTLIDMAQRRPANKDEFAQVKGVGKNKLEQFSAVFLEVINN